MNYYEKIQSTIDDIESKLTKKIDIVDLAKKAFMSKATFYRVFFYIVGDSLYSYIKKRRLSEAAIELIGTDKKIITIALDYQYESHEAFSRAFKSFFGCTPREVRSASSQINLYRRMKIMQDNVNEGYQAKEIIELYPMPVISCHVVGESPEIQSRDMLISWAKENGFPHEIGETTYYGFDNPERCVDREEKEHGYDMWMTIDEKFVKKAKTLLDGTNFSLKHFDGGVYAATKSTVRNVGNAWRELVSWVNISKYEIADRRCLEEALSFDFDVEENIRLRLLMPVVIFGQSKIMPRFSDSQK